MLAFNAAHLALLGHDLTAEMIENLKEMLMPALVIDGLHRLGPTWKEQVFRFVLVNDKPSGIPKPFITSLAGMSLTSAELVQLRDRLTQAGLKLWGDCTAPRFGG